jgi:hypothetical protein
MNQIGYAPYQFDYAPAYSGALPCLSGHELRCEFNDFYRSPESRTMAPFVLLNTSLLGDTPTLGEPVFSIVQAGVGSILEGT